MMHVKPMRILTYLGASSETVNDREAHHYPYTHAYGRTDVSTYLRAFTRTKFTCSSTYFRYLRQVIAMTIESNKNIPKTVSETPCYYA